VITADYGKKVQLPLSIDTIRPIVRADSSGASYIVTQWFNSKAKDLWDSYTAKALAPSGPQRNYPTDGSVARQAGDDGVAGFVNKNRQYRDDSGGGLTSIGYTTPANAAAVNLVGSLVAVKNAAGNYVKPTPQSAASALDAARLNADNTVTLNPDAPKADAYPMSIVTYAIVPTSGLTPEKSLALGTFLRAVATTGQTSASSLGYAALPSPLADRTLKVADQLIAQGPKASTPETNVSSSGSGTGAGGAASAQASGSAGDGSGTAANGLANTGSRPQGTMVAVGTGLVVLGEGLRRRMRPPRLASGRAAPPGHQLTGDDG